MTIKSFWERGGDSVAKIIGVLSSVLSLASFFYVQEYAGLRWIFLISGVCCTIIILSLDNEKGPIKCSNEEKNIETLNRTIMQMKIKRENDGKKINMMN